MILKVVGVKDPVLRQKAKEVTKVDKKIRQLISDMKDTLAAQVDPEGVGLAAPQVGKSLRIFLMKYKNEERVVINPEILETSKELEGKKKHKKSKKNILEGCLSLPHYYGPITRDKKIKIKYLDENGTKQTEEFEGFLTQIIEHEIDHLNGILFIDHILEQKAPLYKFDGEEWEDVDLI